MISLRHSVASEFKVIMDEDARELKGREYYDWIFQNEPKWQEFRT